MRRVGRGREARPVDVAIGEQQRLQPEQAAAAGGIGLAAGADEEAPPGLAAAADRPHRPLPAGRLDPVVERPERGDLRRGEAAGGLGSVALDRCRIPVAGPRIVDQPVLEPVAGVALGEGGILRQLEVVGGEGGAGRAEGVGPHQAGGLRLQRVNRRAGDNRVVIVGVTLRLHQSHAPAGRAADVVGVVELAAVVGGGKLLARNRHLVDRAVAEVLGGFRVLRPGVVPHAGAGMSAVGLHRGVSGLERVAARLQRDVAGPAAAADAVDLAVPVVGKAINHADVRAGDGVQRAADVAVGGQALGGVGRVIGHLGIGEAERGRIERRASLRAARLRGRRRTGAVGGPIGGGAAASQQRQPGDDCITHVYLSLLRPSGEADALDGPAVLALDVIGDQHAALFVRMQSLALQPVHLLDGRKLAVQARRQLACRPSPAKAICSSCAGSSARAVSPSASLQSPRLTCPTTLRCSAAIAFSSSSRARRVRLPSPASAAAGAAMTSGAATIAPLLRKLRLSVELLAVADALSIVISPRASGRSARHRTCRRGATARRPRSCSGRPACRSDSRSRRRASCAC